MKEDKDENKDEKAAEERIEETEKDAVETPDDLVKEKEGNKFVARENSAQIQIFVQNANLGNKTDIKMVQDLLNVSTGSDKKYNLRKPEECAVFFSACKNREYIVLAIVLSVFEIVPIGDYANLKDILAEYLPVVSKIDTEGREIYVQQTNPYISLNTALAVIGGKIFITKEGQRCIGYGEGFEEVLENIWIQFPDLRKPVIGWLLRVNEIFEYKTSFEVEQVVGAFTRIIKKDYQYAKRQMFGKLYSEPDNLGFLARLAQELLQDERLGPDILHMVLRWAESESNWLWKTALLVCLHTYGKDMDNQLHKTMIRIIKKRMFEFQNSDLRFIVLFAGDAGNVKAIAASAFYGLYRTGSPDEKKNLALIYLKMIRYGYYQVNRSRIDLPFVTCDSREQMDNLCPVLAFIMAQYDLYCQLCWILQAYLEEIADYEVTVRTLNHIVAFFYVLSKGNYDYQRDILLFLSEMKGSIAKKIYSKLIKIYESKGGADERIL